MQHLLLLHGAIGAKDQLETLAKQLSKSYIIHTFSFDGHGGMPFMADEFSIPLFAEEVLTYLRDNDISKINIFGYSMGGYVAMYLARHQPTVVEKVITLATKFEWNEQIAAKEIKMLDAAIIQEKVPAFASQLSSRHHPNDWKLVLEKTKSMMVELGQKNVLQPEDYKVIAAPCLLLLGDNDKMITKEETIGVQETLPHGEYRSMPDTAHPIEQVNMDILAGLIKVFVD